MFAAFVGGAGRTETDFHQELVDVFKFSTPFSRAGGVARVVGEQLVVVAQVRAAAAGVGDDRVESERVEEVELAAGEFASGVGVAVVRVERTAAGLDGGRVDFAAVGEKDVHSGAIDVGEDKVLHTAGQHGYAR